MSHRPLSFSPMSFRLTGLSPEPFRPLYGLSDTGLAAHGATRVVADRTPGFPDRIEVRDAAPGATLLLVNYVHQPAATPYRAAHAIFVREGAEVAFDAVDTIPAALARRSISLRGFDATGNMVDAALIDGTALAGAIAAMFAGPAAYLHAHYAVRGCYAARIDRV